MASPVSMPTLTREPPRCQAPFVDIFRYYAVDEWRNSHKEGNVEAVVDKVIGKKVYKIQGKALPSNHLKLPKARGDLGLTGRFLYLQMRPIPSRLFVFHIYAVDSDGTVIDISVNNFIQEKKSVGTLVHYQLNLIDKWTVVVLDMHALLAIAKRRYHHIKGLMMCSNMFVRCCFTSDITYSPQNLPRDFVLPLKASEEWSMRYEWANLPEESPPALIQESFSTLSPVAAAGVNGAAAARVGSAKKRPSTAPPTVSAASHVPLVDSLTNLPPHRVDRHIPAASGAAVGAGIARIPPWAATLQNPPLVTAENGETGNLLDLERVIGFSGANPGAIKWTHDARWIIYACGGTIIVSSADNSEQRFLLGHTAAVSVLAISPDSTLLASSQQGKLAVIRLWDFSTGECVGVLSGFHSSIVSLDYSVDGSQLLAVGPDFQGRSCIVIWNVADILSGGKPSVFLEQSCEIPIRCMRFSPFEDGQFVSCGRENIRFWRLKPSGDRQILSPMTVSLAEHGRREFRDIAFETSHGSLDFTLRQLFVSDDTGLLYQVNYMARKLHRIYRLHTAAINAVMVTDAFCVTGSDDMLVRVWPLDFGDFLLQASQEAPVTSVAVSSDRLKVALGTSIGTVAVLDLPAHNCKTIVRSLQGDIVALAMDPNNEEFTTSCIDGSIRTWDLFTHDQLYGFTAPGDVCTSITYHPSKYVLVCGFRSGTLRVFDIATTSTLWDYRQHEGPITALHFSPDEKRLFSASSDGNLCMYDVLRNYSPLKALRVASAGDDLPLSFNSGGDLIATIGPNCDSLCMFRFDTLHKAVVFSAPRSLRNISFVPDREEVVTVTKDGRIQIYTVEAKGVASESGPLHRLPVRAMDLSPNGKYLATGSDDGKLRIVTLSQVHAATRCSGTFVGHGGGILGVKFSQDGTKVVSVGRSEGIFIWRFNGDSKRDLSRIIDAAVARRTAAQEREEIAQQPDSPPPELPLWTNGISVAAQVNADESASSPSLNRSGFGSVLQEEKGFATSTTARMKMRMAELSPMSGTISPRSPPAPDSVHSVSSTRVTDEGLPLPDSHYRMRRRPARRADPSRVALAPTAEAGLRLVQSRGCNGEARDNVVWEAQSSIVSYSCGGNLVVEDFRGENPQRTFHLMPNDISVIASHMSRRKILAIGCGAAPYPDDDPEIILWDVESETILHRLAFHTKGVQSLAFSPEGDYLVSIGTAADAAVVVWDVETGGVVAASMAPFPLHAVKWVGGGAPGEFVAVGRGRIGFFLVANGETKHVYDAPPGASEFIDYTSVVVSGEGSIVIVGASDGTLSQWRLSALRNNFQHSWVGHRGEVTCLELAGTERLFSAGWEPHVRIWKQTEDRGDGGAAAAAAGGGGGGGGDVVGWEPMHDVSLDGPIRSLCADCIDGRPRFIASTAVGSLWMLDPANEAIPMWQRQLRLSAGHQGRITGVAWGLKGDVAASCSADGLLLVWATQGMEAMKQFDVLGGGCTCVGFALDSSYIAVGCQDGVVRVYGLSRSFTSSHNSFAAHSKAVTCLAMCPGGNFILSGGEDSVVSCTDITTGISVRLPTHALTEGVCQVRLHPTQKRFLATTTTGNLFIWGYTTTPAQASLIHQSAIPPESPSVRLLTSRNLLACFASPSDARHVLLCGPALRSKLLLYDTISREVQSEMELSNVPLSLDISSDTELLVLGTSDRLVKLVDHRAKTFQDFTSHSDSVSTVRFAPNAQYIISSAHTELFLWQVAVPPLENN